jgi:hypothetical protein
MHDKRASNEQFIQGLVLIERAAGDERNFVKKAVEHGPARDRQTQPHAQYCRRGGGAATGGVSGRSGEVGGEGCVAGAYKP